MASVEVIEQSEDDPIFFGDIEITNLKINTDGIPLENSEDHQV